MRRIAYLVGFKYMKGIEFEARGFSSEKKARDYIKRKEKAWGIDFEDWEIKKVILTDYSRYEEYMEVWEGVSLTLKYIMSFLIFLVSYVFSATLLPTHLTLFLFSSGVTWTLMQGIHLAIRLIFFAIDIFDFIKCQTNKDLDLEVFEIQERSLLFQLGEGWKTIKIEGELQE